MAITNVQFDICRTQVVISRVKRSRADMLRRDVLN